MRSYSVLFFTALISLSSAADASSVKSVKVVPKVTVQKTGANNDNPLTKAMKSVKKAITPDDDTDDKSDDNTKDSADSLDDVVEIASEDAGDSYADDVEHSNLRANGDKSEKPTRLFGKVEKHMDDSKHSGLKSRKNPGSSSGKSDEIHAKTVTSASPIKVHLAETETYEDDDQPIAVVEESFTTNKHYPAIPDSFTRQARLIEDLEGEAAERALLASEQTLANEGLTADENIAMQRYMHNIAAGAAEDADGVLDDEYNRNTGDLGESAFRHAESDQAVDNATMDVDASNFASISGAWHKVKSMFGFGPQKKEASVKLTTTAPVASTNVAISGAGGNDLFAFKARPVSRAATPELQSSYSAFFVDANESNPDSDLNDPAKDSDVTD